MKEKDWVNNCINYLFRENPNGALGILENLSNHDNDPHYIGMIRQAVFLPDQSSLYYTRVHNLWINSGKPPLKPNFVKQNIILLTDFTANNLIPLLSLFCAAYGVEVQIDIPDFDSVEQSIFDPVSGLEIKESDIVILILSEHWLIRYLGYACLVRKEDIERAKSAYLSIIEAIKHKNPNYILITNFPGWSYPLPGGTVIFDSDYYGISAALDQMNDFVWSLKIDNIYPINLLEAIMRAGGRAALGNISYFRARMAYEPKGTIAAAHEIATAIVNICGKTHRALVTDWDNTLWGGVLAEAGSNGVICSQDSPDGLGYYLVQKYLKALKSIGIILATASKNNPEASKIFAENPNFAIKADDFISMQTSWAPKSQAIERIKEEVGFGEEYMVFLDDSIFEMAEVFSVHPSIDLLHAGPDPEKTLRKLSDSRFFNVFLISQDDLLRNDRSKSLQRQKELKATFSNINDFLCNLKIILKVTLFNEGNKGRVLQMFQKTNQFNMTTRRHKDNDLLHMKEKGAIIATFSYEDNFGPQGLISVVILLPEATRLYIESWLMSCRVLNRTVEYAVFNWILGKSGGKQIVGEYIPTAKNGIISDLYQRLGFILEKVSEQGIETWVYDPQRVSKSPPFSFARIIEISEE